MSYLCDFKGIHLYNPFFNHNIRLIVTIVVSIFRPVAFYRFSEHTHLF